MAIRKPDTLGWVLIAVCIFAGLIIGASDSPDDAGGQPSLFSGWIVLFVMIAFALGFFAAPMIASASNRGSSPVQLWVFAGLAPLAFLGSAFVSSVLSSTPEWTYLINAACPLGITLRLSSSDDPLESARNIL
jgi:hypothetical protein